MGLLYLFFSILHHTREVKGRYVIDLEFGTRTDAYPTTYPNTEVATPQDSEASCETLGSPKYR